MGKDDRKNIEKKINKQTKSGGKILGAITYWGIEGTIKIDALENLYDKYNLDKEKYFPPEILSTAAFRKSLKTAMRGYDKYIARPIIEDETKIVYGIVREEKDLNNIDLGYDNEVKVAFDKANKQVIYKAKKSGLEAEEIAAETKNLYAEMTQTFVPADIQRILRKCIGIQMGSITLRRSGGFYFSPPHCLEDLEKIQKVVEGINENCDFGLIVITEATKHNVRTLSKETRRSLEDDLNELVEEVKKFQLRGVRETTVANRLVDYNDLRQRCELYSKILKVQVDDIQQGIDDCEQMITAALGIKEKRKKKQKEEDKKLRKMKKINF